MAYTALYRKFRPTTFSEIIGQEAITQTLKNQIMSGRVGHAYLFNGGRGTGKTSAAKILARAVNCLEQKNGEPCNKCEICKAALSASLTDIVEMDAASNNSVEDIRLIRDEVNFLPTIAKYRVYIIDEVHMLSTGAFNALLKTLEEPPEHVKFILATTEPQKLPATILSRCQRFDFKRISNDNIVKRLSFVCEQSKIDITQGALNIIAALSEGAMRDALSILERCIQDGETHIEEVKIKQLVGIPELVQIHKLVSSILECDIQNVLQILEEIKEEGKELQNIVWETLKYIKDILVYKSHAKLELYQEDEIKQIEELANVASKEQLFYMIDSISRLENEMKWSKQKRILFEVSMLKLANTIRADENRNLQERVERLENQLKDMENGIIHNSIKNVEKKTEKVPNTEVNNKKIKSISNATTQKGKTLPFWENVIHNLKQNGKILLYTNLINTVAREINDMTIGIEFLNGLTPFGKTIIEKPENMKELIKLISIECGKEMNIKLIDTNKEGTKQEKHEPIEDMAKSFDIPIQIIE